MDTFRIKKKPDLIGDVIEPTSVDFGGKIYLVYQYIEGFNIVIRKPAYTVWESRAQYGTDPACLMVGTLFFDKEHKTCVKLFWRKETGRKWRDVLCEAIEVASTQRAELPKWGIPYEQAKVY